MPRPNVHYLSGEGKRNREHAALFQRLLHLAFGGCDVIVGHHVAFQFDGDLTTEDEIPSADTLLFDHNVMGMIFGERARDVMTRIAPLLPGERELAVARELKAIGAPA